MGGIGIAITLASLAFKEPCAGIIANLGTGLLGGAVVYTLVDEGKEKARRAPGMRKIE